MTLLLLLSLGGCQATLTTIEVKESATTVVEGAGLIEVLLDSVGFDGFTEMDITSAEELRNQGVEPGDIKDVTLTSFVLDSPDGTLDFISSMAILVEADGYAQATAAHADGLSGDHVAFTIDDLDLTPYVVSENMTVTTEVTAQRPEETTTVNATFTLDVGVTLQGAKSQANQ